MDPTLIFIIALAVIVPVAFYFLPVSATKAEQEAEKPKRPSDLEEDFTRFYHKLILDLAGDVSFEQDGKASNSFERYKEYIDRLDEFFRDNQLYRYHQDEDLARMIFCILAPTEETARKLPVRYRIPLFAGMLENIMVNRQLVQDVMVRHYQRMLLHLPNPFHGVENEELEEHFRLSLKEIESRNLQRIIEEAQCILSPEEVYGLLDEQRRSFGLLTPENTRKLLQTDFRKQQLITLATGLVLSATGLLLVRAFKDSWTTQFAILALTLVIILGAAWWLRNLVIQGAMQEQFVKLWKTTVSSLELDEAFMKDYCTSKKLEPFWFDETPEIRRGPDNQP